MNTILAAVLLAVVATCSGTAVLSNAIVGGQQLYYPSAAVQYVSPSHYVQQPVVASSSSAYTYSVPSTGYNYVYPSSAYYGLQYPYYSYGSYGLLKK